MKSEDGGLQARERFVRSFLDWVMLAILQRKPSYGYEMIATINEEYGVYVSPGSLYPILYNLERSGMITGTWDQPDRKSKKVYELTPSGTRAFREQFDAVGRVLASLRETPREPPRR